MSQDNSDNVQNMIIAGVTVGILAGAAIGIVFARKAHQQTTDEISETVENLKNRAQLVLSELSENVTELIDKSRELFPDSESLPSAQAANTTN